MIHELSSVRRMSSTSRAPSPSPSPSPLITTLLVTLALTMAPGVARDALAQTGDRQLVQLGQVDDLGTQLLPRLVASLEALESRQDALGTLPVLPQVGLFGLPLQLAQALLHPVPFKDTSRTRRSLP